MEWGDCLWCFVLLLLPGDALVSAWHTSNSVYASQVVRAMIRLGFSPDNEKVSVLDVGSQNFNGAFHDYVPPKWNFTGVDVMAAKGVDIVLEDPYTFPFADRQFDLVASFNAFEHCDFFWLMFLEMVRVSRRYIYINAPSDYFEHGEGVLVDSWRFYRQAGGSLLRWAHHQGYKKLQLSQAFVSSLTKQGYRDANFLFSVAGDGGAFHIADKWEYKLTLRNRCWVGMNSTQVRKRRWLCVIGQGCSFQEFPFWCCAHQGMLPPQAEAECRQYGYLDFATCCSE